MLNEQSSDNEHRVFLVGGFGFRKLDVWDISGIIPGRLSKSEASRFFGCLPKDALVSPHPGLWWSSGRAEIGWGKVRKTLGLAPVSSPLQPCTSTQF